jgi:hypothetical protein
VFLEKSKNFLFDSLYAVLRLLGLGLLAGIVILLCLFSIDFGAKNYDLVFTSRLNSSMYYGIEYKKKFKVWEVNRSTDGSLSTSRIYP